MKNPMFVLVFILMLFAGCQKDSALFELALPADKVATQNEKIPSTLHQPVKEVYLGQPVTMRVNEVVTILPDRIRVSFKAVTEDSRCPSGYQCFWEGRAVVRLTFEKYDDFLTALLATPSSVAEPASETTVFNRNVKLLGVAPYPESKRPIPLEKYRVTLVVEKTGGADGI